MSCLDFQLKIVSIQYEIFLIQTKKLVSVIFFKGSKIGPLLVNFIMFFLELAVSQFYFQLVQLITLTSVLYFIVDLL